MIKRKSAIGNPDKILITTSSILIFIGLLLLSTVSVPYSLDKFKTPLYYLKHQIFYGLLPGLLLIFLIYRQNLTSLKRLAFGLFILNLFLVILTIVPGIGHSLGGASRWLSLGPISFQPTEFLKLTFILYLSAWLSERRKLKFWQGKGQLTQVFLPFISLLGILAIILIKQPDISTLGVIGLTGLAIYFISQTPKWQATLIFILGILFLFVVVKINPYAFHRIAVFLNPNFDPMGIGYQIKQAKIAIGSGGLLGVEGDLSLGLSRQKFGFLPQPMNDSIFAIYAEETGFIGSLFLILLYLVFAWRGFLISQKIMEQDFFLALIAFGITFWIVLQSFINISAIVGLLPLTGIPLSFISYGGSALLSELIALGILIKISTMVNKS